MDRIFWTTFACLQGCEASVLLDKTSSEKTAPINVNLHGFEAIDAAKAAVEKACPGVVSCADILQYAARDAVVLVRELNPCNLIQQFKAFRYKWLHWIGSSLPFKLLAKFVAAPSWWEKTLVALQTGGQTWDVFGGRRDGTESNAAEPAEELPTQTMTVSQILSTFATKNLNAGHMVALSGSHTLGVAHCSKVTDRLYTFNSASGSDPSLPTDLLDSLKASCPSAAGTAQLNLDEQTPNKFDTKYFDNIIKGRGILGSDQRLLNDSTTAAEISANNGANFGTNFASAMVVMASYNVLTNTAGEIRTNCRKTLAG